MATEQQAREVKQRHSLRLLQQEGVSGVGVERDKDGNYFLAISLATDDPKLQASIPRELDGCPTKINITGSFNKLS